MLHEEEDIPGAKGIPLPGSVNREWSLGGVHVRKLGVFARWVNPLAPPPCLRLIEAASIVIARQIINLFPAMLFQYTKLPDDLLSFGIFRQAQVA
jgi:hypothetical protein